MTSDPISESLRRAMSFQFDRKFFLAEMLFGQLAQAEPPDYMSRFMYGQFKLLKGDFAEGWPLFQERLKTQFYLKKGTINLPQPWWNGEEIPDKILLVHVDQGIGDAILCARFVPQVADRVGKLIVGVHQGMKAFFEDIDPRINAIELGDPVPAFDVHVDFFSLLPMFGGKPGDIPPPPYVATEPKLARRWKKRLDGPGLAVGLVWQGNRGHARDAERSIPLKDLEPVLKTPGVRFYGLQVGDGAEQVADLPGGLDFTDLSQDLTDGGMIVTAAIIENLDLVISVDTAVANLAGAMGKLLWVPVSSVPDWRWVAAGETDPPRFEPGPWYPEAVLFFQEPRWDWTGVIDGMADELRKMADGG